MKYLVVLGAGESGVGAALLGKAKNWRVYVSDFGKIAPKKSMRKPKKASPKYPTKKLNLFRSSLPN